MTYNQDAFAVTLPSKQLDPSGFYKKGLVDKLTKEYPWLTVAGLDSPFYLKNGRELRGIQYAGPDNVLTFGTAKNHDVNWVERADYARSKGYAPILDLQKNYSEVMSKLAAFAAARKPKPVYRTYSYTTYCSCTSAATNTVYVDGKRIEVYDNFIKVGSTIIPRYPRTNEFCGYTKSQIEAVKYIIIALG